jgi:hypothetical protein
MSKPKFRSPSASLAIPAKPSAWANRKRCLELRLEAYNAFNHANFANPSGSFWAGSAVFGVIDSVNQPINAGGDPQPGRAIQLAGKFYF